ncbi:MAG: sigma-70 family RNA polymerase sigma factor [Myxococcota bacterium]
MTTRNTDLIAEALREHRAALFAFVRARMPAEEVDDLLQRVALRAVERADSLQDPSRVVGWLFRLHRNAIVDAARKRARRRIVESTGEEPVAETDVDERCRCSVVQAQRLGTTYAHILELVDIEGCSLPEAAETLGTTVNAATVRLHRARKALRKRMQDHCGVTSADECDDCRCSYDGCCAA